MPYSVSPNTVVATSTAAVAVIVCFQRPSCIENPIRLGEGSPFVVLCCVQRAQCIHTLCACSSLAGANPLLGCLVSTSDFLSIPDIRPAGNRTALRLGFFSYSLMLSLPVHMMTRMARITDRHWLWPSSKWIHHSTWQYYEVPKTFKAVHEGRRPSSCTFMYFLVPPYSGVQDFWVLHCSAMYCDVATCRISRHYCVGNQSMYWYVLVCACMY
jgi:hypothetical protein